MQTTEILAKSLNQFCAAGLLTATAGLVSVAVSIVTVIVVVVVVVIVVLVVVTVLQLSEGLDLCLRRCHVSAK